MQRVCVMAMVLGSIAGCGLPGDAPAWEQVRGEGPAERWGHVAAYDPARERMLVFGGDQRRGQRSDVWALDLESLRWAELVTGDGPGPRSDLAEVLDVARDRWIMIGGRAGFARSIDEVWALDLATLTWEQWPSGPSARHDVSAASDGERAWVFGGAAELGQSLDDLWELDLETREWRALPVRGPRPIARTSYAFVYFEGSLYLHGGHDILRAFSDTWRYELESSRWVELAADGGAIANAHTGHDLDAECGTLVLGGGDNLDGFVTSMSTAIVLGERPQFERVRASVLPPPRDHASLIVDGQRRLVLFGGGALGEGLDTYDDTWMYPLGACP